MKKVLIGALIVLLVIMAYFAIFKGISIGKMEVLSVEQIQKQNDKLSEGITQVDTLMHTTYRTKTDELEQSVSSLLNAKEEYQDLASVSTQGELNQASKQESYKIEYLWTRIGSHATAEGVDLKLDIMAGETGESDVKNLSFNITGDYRAIINFISSIEDDSQLGFRIENFKILPGSGENGRQATFTVRNIRIKSENASGGTTQATDTNMDATQTSATPDAQSTTPNQTGTTN